LIGLAEQPISVAIAKMMRARIALTLELSGHINREAIDWSA